MRTGRKDVVGVAALTPCTYAERDWFKEIMGDGERGGEMAESAP